MSTQVAVNSIAVLKDFRTSLALYSEETLAALGAVDAEVRRTVVWLQQDRPAFWHDQIKRRTEQLASAKAELFRRQIATKSSGGQSMSEQKENVRRAEASLQDAERRLIMVRKWQPALQQAILEYKASVRRVKDLAAGDVLRGVDVLGRIIDSLEAYLRVAPPSASAAPSSKAPPEFEAIASDTLDREPEIVESSTPADDESDASHA